MRFYGYIVMTPARQSTLIKYCEFLIYFVTRVSFVLFLCFFFNFIFIAITIEIKAENKILWLKLNGS